MSIETRYVDEREVSRITGRSLQTLRNDRFLRRGIPYCKIGRSVRYNSEEVLRFMEAHKVQTESLKR